MKPRPTPSLAAPLGALILALIVAGLVLWCDWTPWEAVAVMAGSALSLSIVGIISLMAMTRSRRDRAELWTLFVDTAKADLQPFVVLWRLIRGRRR